MSPGMIGILMVVGMVAIAFLTTGRGGSSQPAPPYGWGMPQRRWNGSAFAAWMFTGLCTVFLFYAVLRSPGSVIEIVKVLVQDLGLGG